MIIQHGQQHAGENEGRAIASV